MSFSSIDAGWWPFVYILIAGWFATDFWRYAGVLLGRRLSETSEAFVFVRAVATALVAAVISRLILFPSGSLAETALADRAGDPVVPADPGVDAVEKPPPVRHSRLVGESRAATAPMLPNWRPPESRTVGCSSATATFPGCLSSRSRSIEGWRRPRRLSGISVCARNRFCRPIRTN